MTNSPDLKQEDSSKPEFKKSCLVAIDTQYTIRLSDGSRETKENKNYYPWDNPTDFWNAKQEVPRENWCFYEMTRFEPLKYYQDIEIEESNLIETGATFRTITQEWMDLYVGRIIKISCAVLRWIVRDEHAVNYADIVYLTSHKPLEDGKFKWSYHLIYPLVVPNPYICKNISQYVNHLHEHDYKKYIGKCPDLSPYANFHPFRMVGSSKIGKNRFLTHQPEWRLDENTIVKYRHSLDPKDVFIRSLLVPWHDVESVSITEFSNRPELLDFLLNPVNYGSKLRGELPSVPRPVATGRGDITYPALQGDIDVRRLINLLGEERDNFEYEVVNGEIKRNGSLITLKRIRRANCSICNRVHGDARSLGDNSYVIIMGNQQKVYFNCHRNQTGEFPKRYLGSLRPEADPDPFVPVQRSSPTAVSGVVSTSSSESKVYIEPTINERFDGPRVPEIKDPPEGYSALLYDSFMSSGKTHQTIEYLKDHPEAPTIILTPRQSYSRSIVKRYNVSLPEAQQFVDYLSVAKSGRKTYPRIAISLESVWDLAGSDHKYEIIIFDESESLFSQYSSTTMAQKTYAKGATPILIKNLNTIDYLIRNARLIIGGDAFLSYRSQVAFGLYDKKVYVHQNRSKPEPRIASRMQQYDQLEGKLKEHLLNGRRCVAVITSKLKIKELEPWLKENNITYIAYYAGCRKDTLGDVNTSWKTPQLLIYNTSITVGISYDANVPEPGASDDRFDDLFVYCGKGQNIRDVFQAMTRVRHFKNSTMWFCLGKTSKSTPPPEIFDPTAMSQYVERNTDHLRAICETHGIDLKKEGVPLHVIHSMNLVEKSKDFHCIKAVFEAYLAKCNYTIEEYAGEAPIITPPVPINPIDYRSIPSIIEYTAENIRRRIQDGIAREDDEITLKKYWFDKKLKPEVSLERRVILWPLFSDETEQLRYWFDHIYRLKSKSIKDELTAELARYCFALLSPGRGERRNIFDTICIKLSLTDHTSEYRFAMAEIENKANELFTNPAMYNIRARFDMNPKRCAVRSADRQRVETILDCITRYIGTEWDWIPGPRTSPESFSANWCCNPS